tara:strand:- start:657 stop:863 length:207 start_codon:yes stop_codon:yes gene_type:complete
MSEKNVEMRMSLLNMAISILESKNKRLEQNEHFGAENDKMYNRKSIKPYTTEDVVLEAKKLYDFIQNK